MVVNKLVVPALILSGSPARCDTVLWKKTKKKSDENAVVKVRDDGNLRGSSGGAGELEIPQGQVLKTLNGDLEPSGEMNSFLSYHEPAGYDNRKKCRDFFDTTITKQVASVDPKTGAIVRDPRGKDVQKYDADYLMKLNTGGIFSYDRVKDCNRFYVRCCPAKGVDDELASTQSSGICPSVLDQVSNPSESERRDLQRFGAGHFLNNVNAHYQNFLHNCKSYAAGFEEVKNGFGGAGVADDEQCKKSYINNVLTTNSYIHRGASQIKEFHDISSLGEDPRSRSDYRIKNFSPDANAQHMAITAPGFYRNRQAICENFQTVCKSTGPPPQKRIQGLQIHLVFDWPYAFGFDGDILNAKTGYSLGYYAAQLNAKKLYRRLKVKGLQAIVNGKIEKPLPDSYYIRDNEPTKIDDGESEAALKIGADGFPKKYDYIVKDKADSINNSFLYDVTLVGTDTSDPFFMDAILNMKNARVKEADGTFKDFISSSLYGTIDTDIGTAVPKLKGTIISIPADPNIHIPLDRSGLQRFNSDYPGDDADPRMSSSMRRAKLMYIPEAQLQGDRPFPEQMPVRITKVELGSNIKSYHRICLNGRSFFELSIGKKNAFTSIPFAPPEQWGNMESKTIASYISQPKSVPLASRPGHVEGLDIRQSPLQTIYHAENGLSPFLASSMDRKNIEDEVVLAFDIVTAVDEVIFKKYDDPWSLGLNIDRPAYDVNLIPPTGSDRNLDYKISRSSAGALRKKLLGLSEQPFPNNTWDLISKKATPDQRKSFISYVDRPSTRKMAKPRTDKMVMNALDAMGQVNEVRPADIERSKFLLEPKDNYSDKNMATVMSTDFEFLKTYCEGVVPNIKGDFAYNFKKFSEEPIRGWERGSSEVGMGDGIQDSVNDPSIKSLQNPPPDHVVPSGGDMRTCGSSGCN